MDNLIYLIYGGPQPQQRRKKPMEILCVGISRSGTESLRSALLHLGFDHTYHGWDTLLSPRFQLQAWYKLYRRKHTILPTGKPAQITASDFDAIIGHCVAITDLPAAEFAQELITAYPSAKVILNKRDDLDAWYRSFDSTMGVFDRNPVNIDWLLSWFSRDLFWIRQYMSRTQVPGFFGGSFEKNGKKVYMEHMRTIRGMGLSKERLLEWKVEDGWGPLCKFLGKDTPRSEFPSGNTPTDWQRRITSAMVNYYVMAVLNMALFVGIGLAIGGTLSGRFRLPTQ